MDEVESILKLPAVVHDEDGREVCISVEARAELLRRAQAGECYAYQAGTDPAFFNLWFQQMIHPPTGYRGVRQPLAQWVRWYEAGRADREASA